MNKQSLIFTDATLAWLIIKRFPIRKSTHLLIFIKVCPLWANLLNRRLILHNFQISCKKLHNLKQDLTKQELALKDLLRPFIKFKLTSGYLSFCQEERAKSSYPLRMHELGTRWGHLSDTAKNDWNKLAKENPLNSVYNLDQSIIDKIQKNLIIYKNYLAYLHNLDLNKQSIDEQIKISDDLLHSLVDPIGMPS